MPDPSTPCGRAITETALWPFQGWPTLRAGGLQPSSTPLYTRTPYAYADKSQHLLFSQASSDVDFVTSSSRVLRLPLICPIVIDVRRGVSKG
jgi:hypothetical protein